ncbi:histidine phosphatase family protein [Nocardioides sp. S-58]|uniref:Histidine phosphatase family protein n=1 Tax=Nocardioides renjunii TaxID=3095075 RepID=A0ABU5KDW8_9ACTN|nr:MULTISPECIES: histidine phosphatase family protein [unclassified Nocardioides]MDZ5663163.1 histidine phosphatase family protein [Nocardioides sp. S-58]WQQ22953.1 histidine phosphatase family protein [Nocardioides sp. S-34]
MRLLLMRHGQTHANVSGELDTAHPGVDLTDLGRAQAVAASKALADEHLDAIYVSSRVRTHQTAAPTAEDRGLEPTVVEGLEEIAAGDFEMRNDHDAVSGYIGTVATWLEGDLAHRMPGGETGEEFLARFDAAVRRIVEAGHDAALVVSHGAALRTWVSTRMAPHPDAPPATQPLHNTALIVLEGDDESGWEMVSWQGHPVGGDYLEDPTAEDPTGDLDADGDGEIG